MSKLFLAVGIVFVLSCLPAFVNFLWARRRFSGRLIVTCPETQGSATIHLNAFRAAATGLTGQPDLKVKSCTRWSGPAGQCREQCLVENDALLLDQARPA